MFEDTYAEQPPNLLKQEAELMEHIAMYPNQYNLDGHLPNSGKNKKK